MKKYLTPKSLWMILIILICATIFADISLVRYLTPLMEVTPQHIILLVIVQILLAFTGFFGAMLYSKKKAR
jgi:type III secretory pathway component EscS